METYTPPELTRELREAIDEFIMGNNRNGEKITTLADGQLAFQFIDHRLARLDPKLRMKILTKEVYPAARDITSQFTNAVIES